MTRLAEMQRRVIRALGEVSFEQFHDPEPIGYLAMRLSETGFNVSVEYRSVLVLNAIYYEPLITPESLQHRRVQLLAPVLKRAAQQHICLSDEMAEIQMLEQLKNGENHWDGRKKADLSFDILSADGVVMKALSFTDKDFELDLQSFAINQVGFQQLTRKLLGIIDRQENDQH